MCSTHSYRMYWFPFDFIVKYSLNRDAWAKRFIRYRYCWWFVNADAASCCHNTCSLLVLTYFGRLLPFFCCLKLIKDETYATTRRRPPLYLLIFHFLVPDVPDVHTDVHIARPRRRRVCGNSDGTFSALFMCVGRKAKWKEPHFKLSAAHSIFSSSSNHFYSLYALAERITCILSKRRLRSTNRSPRKRATCT